MPRDWWLARRRLSEEERYRQSAQLVIPWLEGAKQRLLEERRGKGGKAFKFPGWAEMPAWQRILFLDARVASESLSSDGVREWGRRWREVRQDD